MKVTGYALEHAAASGACRRCSIDEPKWHNEDPCPHWATVDRLNAVPCKSAVCARMTRRFDGCCSDVCAARIARREAS